MIKHVGKVGEAPCVILYREVPQEPDNCLVVETNSLSSQYHDALMAVVQSPEAQEASELSEVLNRRQFVDGTNMLAGLHYAKKIRKAPVSLVTLTPLPNQSVSLAEVNTEIRKIKNKSNPPLKTELDPSKLSTPAVNPITESVNTNVVDQQPVVNTTDADAVAPQDTVSIAENLLNQANLIREDAHAMLADAEAKINQAYELAPELKPKSGPGRPRKGI
jgi:hypothetical protein